MKRVGVVESTVPVGKYLAIEKQIKQSSILVVDLAANVDFTVYSEILKKLDLVKR